MDCGRPPRGLGLHAMTSTLSEAVDAYVAYRRVAFKPNSAKASEQALRKFLLVVGNIQTRSLGPEHGERFQSHLMTRGYAPNSVNNYLSQVSQFSKWAAARRLLRPGSGPTATIRISKVALPPRLRIPASEFPRVLDSAERPDIRILLALGLYLFARSGEILERKVGDVSLERDEINVYVRKSNIYDVMPICLELHEELERWFAVYEADLGRPLRPDDYLVPAHRPTGWYDLDRNSKRYNPGRMVCQPSRLIHSALTSAGYPVRDEKTGKTNREGVHTLRRSGARAYYDELIETGKVRDDVLRMIMALLHHRSVVVTERYLGLEADRERRDLRVRGQRMFSSSVTASQNTPPEALEGTPEARTA